MSFRGRQEGTGASGRKEEGDGERVSVKKTFKNIVEYKMDVM